MTELFLLGAGASVEAGVPDAYRMPKEMLKNFSEEVRAKYLRYDKVLEFVVGGLLFQQGFKGENPFDGVNIEDLFNAVLLLGDRQNSELSPFISSWHPQLIGLESGKMTNSTSRELLKTIDEPIEKFVKETTDELLKHVEYLINRRGSSSSSSKKIDNFFASSRFETVFADAVRQISSGSEGKLFKATADAMVQQLVKMVWITDQSKVNYLVPLISYVGKTTSFIVTLNYDNTIELAGQVQGVEIDTGFDAWSTSGEFAFGDGKIPLIKLHGSIDWALSSGNTGKEKPLPYQIIQKIDPNSIGNQTFQPAVIFGGKNKLTAKGPFLSLLRSFETQLSTTEILTIIGYSFRDEHVNEFITNWFNGDVSRRMRIINPNPDGLNDGFARPLLNDNLKDRVQVIGDVTSNGILSLQK
jgi:NAD-dependent SIR2 family protein deacetylase